MIGRISGILIEKEPPTLLVDVAGVGYQIDAPMSTFYQLPALSEAVVLHIQTVVREDALLLYGFASKAERSMFCKLVSVSGIGPRLGLTVLSGMSVNELAEAIGNQDVDLLIRVPGIGRKTAERLLLDLKDKMEEFRGIETQVTGSLVLASSIVDEAVSALEALGYKRAEATKVVRKIENEAHTDSESLIKAALKGLMR
ncbi:MAG: Holliday junction branch migration protein RuvA [Gammaproteobacteria bacterium]|nr:MAG: Holliday junction branch migration protein RuvA [Gammaproteobacteria bacterium]RLA16017.1 MAG: Holliday junction branch migration protein RuvA [Gammaproteobacteria bacterium]RLA16417.1 MAG: Holliday junction branch migration protein RuvA [Gammaproteobacteria bacterium]